jgi:hypothetical protein
VPSEVEKYPAISPECRLCHNRSWGRHSTRGRAVSRCPHNPIESCQHALPRATVSVGSQSGNAAAQVHHSRPFCRRQPLRCTPGDSVLYTKAAHHSRLSTGPYLRGGCGLDEHLEGPLEGDRLAEHGGRLKRAHRHEGRAPDIGHQRLGCMSGTEHGHERGPEFHIRARHQKGFTAKI